MQSQKQPKTKTNDPGASAPGGSSDTGAAKAALKKGTDILGDIDAAIKQAKKQEQKQQAQKVRMICCCGDPSCGVGPFNKTYRG